MADISYNKTTWVNGSTALNAANLNNIEMGVDNATKAINNKVDKVAGKGLSTHDFNDHYKNAIDNLQDVEANPSETGTTDLTKLKVGSTVYNIPSGGTNVEANPTGTGTADLTKLKVGGTIYNIPSGSSSGGLTFPTTPPTSQLIPSITTSNKQQNLAVGDGLTIENGVLKATGGGGSGSDVSVFDLTPYFDGGESIGTEGYNALKDYLANNNCPMVRLDLGGGEMYCFNVSMYNENTLLCSLVSVNGGEGGAVGGEITAMQFKILNSGNLTISQAQLAPTEAIVEQGTDNLKGLKIGRFVYNIPRLETYTLNINNNTGNPLPLKILTCETTTEGKMLLKVIDGNFGIGHQSQTLAIGFVYKQLPFKSSGYINLFTTNDGTFAILTGNAEYTVN